MGLRPLVIMAVLGWLVGAAGLAQACGGHGGHHGHSRHGGPHHGEPGHVVPGSGFHGGVLVLPSGGLAPAPPVPDDTMRARTLIPQAFSTLVDRDILARCV
jgi:hypothetical protein